MWEHIRFLFLWHIQELKRKSEFYNEQKKKGTQA